MQIVFTIKNVALCKCGKSRFLWQGRKLGINGTEAELEHRPVSEHNSRGLGTCSPRKFFQFKHPRFAENTFKIHSEIEFLANFFR